MEFGVKSMTLIVLADHPVGDQSSSLALVLVTEIKDKSILPTFNVVPARLNPVPRVTSSITPVPAVHLPINLLVAMLVDMLGVAPPLEVRGEVAPTLETPPPPPPLMAT